MAERSTKKKAAQAAVQEPKDKSGWKGDGREIIMAKVTGGRLNVRPEPSLNKPPVRILEDGTEVEVLEVNDGWCRVGDGYVMSGYLNFD